MKRLLLFVILCCLACHANQAKQPEASASSLFEKLPDTTVAIFSGDKAQDFWKDTLFWRLRFLTLFQFSAQRGFFSQLTEVASKGRFKEIGLSPTQQTALVLDAELVTERYEAVVSRGASRLFEDYTYEKSALSYAVLPLRDQKLLREWLVKILKRESQSASLRDVMIAKKAAMIFSDKLIFVIDGPLLYVFPVGFRFAHSEMESAHPLDSMGLFQAQLALFFDKKEHLQSSPSFQAAQSKLKPGTFFFLDTSRLASLLSLARTIEYFRVTLPAGEQPAFVESVLAEKNSAQANEAALQSQALSFSSVVPWVVFGVSGKDVSEIEGFAPLTTLYEREIALSLKENPSEPNWDLLFSGETSYFAHFSLHHDMLTNETASSFLTAWIDPKERIDTGSYWEKLIGPLQKSGFDLKKHLLDNATGDVAFAVLGIADKETERFLATRSTPGARQAEAVSIRGVGVINSVLELFQTVSRERMLEFAAGPGNIVAIQMKSPEAASAVLSALDALAAQDPTLASNHNEVRSLALSEGKSWRFATRGDLLLIGGKAEDLISLREKKEGSLNQQLASKFPFEESRVGAFLQLDLVLESLAKKEESRQNPTDAKFYRDLKGRGPLWFSLSYEDGLLRYSARLP